LSRERFERRGIIGERVRRRVERLLRASVEADVRRIDLAVVEEVAPGVQIKRAVQRPVEIELRRRGYVRAASE
jgi:hypothetical protein